MQISEATAYTVAVQATNQDGVIYSTLYAGMGWEDDSVLELVTVLRAFEWPSGLGSIAVSATKNDTTSNFSQCNANTNPPVFS
jgi:hypothetical protein